MKAIFVAGTDTGAGKSVVTGLLAKYISESGRSVVTQKWVQTGLETFPEDIDTHLTLMGRKRSDYAGHLDSMVPYSFRFPASPHLASGLEKGRIETDGIKKAFDSLAGRFDFVIVEGSGGLLVPINEKTLSIDIIKDLRLPVLLAAANRLGSVNHTLLSIEALKARDIKISGVIFNNISGDTDERILNDNPEVVKKFSGVKVFGLLPYAKDIHGLYKKFSSMGEEIVAGL